MKVLFLIPARAGSKGVPDKSLQPVGGLPLIGRSAMAAHSAIAILAARNGEPVNAAGHRVVCSTDSDAMGAVAVAYGAEYVKRDAAWAAYVGQRAFWSGDCASHTPAETIRRLCT